MKNFAKLFIIILFISIYSCHEKTAIEHSARGIILKLENTEPTKAKSIKVEAYSENVIRITASPTDTFSSRKSLMINEDELPEIQWLAIDKEDHIEFSTSKIKANINKTTGEINFFDSKGNPVLKEKAGDGKTFTAANIMNEQTYNIHQKFESTPDEAFYGLGQHQNNLMNYKGHNVELVQGNIVAVVPLLISNKNYGILWDNYSITRFGDQRPYQPISGLELYSKTGEKDGLTAEYFNSSDFTDLAVEATVNTIDFKYLSSLDNFPEGFELGDNVSIRWSGEIASQEAGIHTFLMYSSCYTKLWIDGKQICDLWRQNWNPWTTPFKIDMKPGEKHQIKIEWIPESNEAYFSLEWLSPSKNDPNTTTSLFSEVGDQIDYYFIYGENTDTIIKNYRALTGDAPMMPKWAYGLWQCRERYKTQEELLDVVREFRKRQIPLDNIVQDWQYWEDDKWGTHAFDRKRFPNPVQMVNTLHDELNTRIMISVWPKFYVGVDNYNAMNEKGYLYTKNVEENQKDWINYVSTFYDSYNEGARELFWKQINDSLFSKGVDAWWLDATEPDIHSNLSIKNRKYRMHPTALGSGARYFNGFSLMNSKGIYEGQRKADPDKRVFILTRSAYAGQQRYASATWSGDIVSRWHDLEAQIPAGLNFCLSGIPYWTTDIGGFAVEKKYEKANAEDLDEWRELNTRWFQYGTFCPLFRVHGQFPYREMYNIAPENHPAYQTMLRYDRLRYKLMPYIYSLAGKITHNGYTLMRALIMDFGNDQKVTNIGDQFMFGPSLLINPVYKYKARSREVYLPESAGWYALETGKYFNGGQTITAEAPYEKIPIFVKEGSVIPAGQPMQYTGQNKDDVITLYVYTGADAEFTLYEDENLNYNYENGDFTTIDFKYNEESKTLTIGSVQGKFNGMLNERTLKIVWVSKEKAISFDFTGEYDQEISYTGKELTVTMK